MTLTLQCHSCHKRTPMRLDPDRKQSPIQTCGQCMSMNVTATILPATHPREHFAPRKTHAKLYRKIKQAST